MVSASQLHQWAINICLVIIFAAENAGLSGRVAFFAIYYRLAWLDEPSNTDYCKTSGKDWHNTKTSCSELVHMGGVGLLLSLIVTVATFNIVHWAMSMENRTKWQFKLKRHYDKL